MSPVTTTPYHSQPILTSPTPSGRDTVQIRRSTRLAKKPLIRTLQKNTVYKRADESVPLPDNHHKAVKRSKKCPSSPDILFLVDDIASESTCSSQDSNSDCEPDTESDTDSQEETTHLSLDNMHYVAADMVDRRDSYNSCHSYDSRCEDGNNDYEFDGFVVADGNEDSVADLEDSKEEADESDGGVEVQRRASVYSTSTQSSGESLFVSKTKRKRTKTHPHVCTHHYSKALVQQASAGAFSELTLTNAEPEDVAEEITNAVALFSRRCNRYCKPLVLKLSRRMMEEETVCEALGAAGSLGFATGVEMEEGCAVWWIGPRAVVGCSE